jgi:hypothetical protein
MHLLDRIGITVLATALAAFVIYWLSSEVVVLWEMSATGASDRSELGDDLGLGILLFLFCLPTTFIGTVFAGLYVWGWTGTKRCRKDERA